jgi:primosomal replication protein N
MLGQDVKALSTLWLEAKAKETEATNQRIAIEKALIELIGAREEGSQSTDLGDGIKVTTTGRLSYKADPTDLLMLTMAWPVDIQPAYMAPKLDETRLKKIRSDHPDLWRSIAHAVTVKPQKTSVTITQE